jgi:hypothetical protein
MQLSQRKLHPHCCIAPHRPPRQHRFRIAATAQVADTQPAYSDEFDSLDDRKVRVETGLSLLRGG